MQYHDNALNFTRTLGSAMMVVRKGMQSELGIVRDVSARLERGGLAYMLTGSMAMNHYAQPRMMRDVTNLVATGCDVAYIAR